MLSLLRAYRFRRHQERRLATLRRLARSLPSVPVYLDVGARDGLEEPWSGLCAERLVHGIAVEPDPAEHQRLQRAYPHLTCLPHALASTEGPRPFHITRTLGCCSLLPPDLDALAPYPVSSYFELIRTVSLPTTRFDSLLRQNLSSAPDFLKLDVQGAEHEVLLGFGTALDHVIALELEARFHPVYRGETPAASLIAWLRTSGFILRDIRRQGPFEHEFLEANFFFSRRPSDLHLSRRPLLALWETACDIPPPSFATPIDQLEPRHLASLAP